ncbi:hypothetical protein FEM48_Zijuj08G0156200 [Ziziphus jujuba var. spinosa]|uniref:Uncharacterized protein n=1 Tax=Ziziphus jujuba var. spinosa TaxID=714518 RepID=A0A978UZY7_ZIZJJ|nr:hypothetical protein FEM48_Zijuj08G0156200 [Ziziphus jujuba var. spinosa]
MLPLPLKLVRSLVFGQTINNNPFLLTRNHSTHHQQHQDEDNDDDDDDDEEEEEEEEDGDDNHDNGLHHHHRHHHHRKCTRPRLKSKNAKSKTPLLLFLPTKELVTDTYRLATIARDMGMDLHPTPSLSHIILSYPSSSSSPSSTSPSSFPSSWSSSSLSSSCSLPSNAVPLPFPSFSSASLTHLRSFVKLSKGLFKLVFLSSNGTNNETSVGNSSNWNCCSISLFSRLTGDRIDTMEGFCRALAGKGWTLFKTKENPSVDSGDRIVPGRKSVYLFRKVETSRVRSGRRNGDGGNGGESRVRELRLPQLDFRNAPLRILQYILLMTDDMFYLA